MNHTAEGSDLVVPFMMRAWMDKVEAFCNKVDAYLDEVEKRLSVVEVYSHGRPSCRCDSHVSNG